MINAIVLNRAKRYKLRRIIAANIVLFIIMYSKSVRNGLPVHLPNRSRFVDSFSTVLRETMNKLSEAAVRMTIIRFYLNIKTCIVHATYLIVSY